MFTWVFFSLVEIIEALRVISVNGDLGCIDLTSRVAQWIFLTPGYGPEHHCIVLKKGLRSTQNPISIGRASKVGK